jgi:2-polyprenyl-3-methyl-5-hydroxy-6-metoxy-1,4-benzoquinol methylase
MPCCCPHSRSAGRFFSRFARRYRQRFRRKGFEPLQRGLLEGIERAGVQGATLLEIGCGVGTLHQHLLKQGAARAVGVDLAPRMIEEAEALAREDGLADRTRYRVGDFVEEAQTFDPADVVILDKVICCYPDAQRIVEASAGRARRVYAYSIPRDRWYTRLGAALAALAFRLFGSDFRPYVHDPGRIDAWLAAAGFARRYEHHTLAWLTRVCVLER